MDWHLVGLLAGVTLVFAAAFVGGSGRDGAGLATLLIGFVLAMGSMVSLPSPSNVRASAARATIAAATAAVAGATAESELRALERAAATAAAAVKGGE